MVTKRLESHGSQEVEGGHGRGAGEFNNNGNNKRVRPRPSCYFSSKFVRELIARPIELTGASSAAPPLSSARARRDARSKQLINPALNICVAAKAPTTKRARGSDFEGGVG